MHFSNDSNEVCNKVVQDLKRHLVFVHKLDSCCSKFEEFIKDPSTIKRHVGVKSVSMSDAGASYANTKMIRSQYQHVHERSYQQDIFMILKLNLCPHLRTTAPVKKS